VDELSGGQFMLVNEAVSLGIAIYNRERYVKRILPVCGEV
jgi:predicted RNA-binding Zn-ribbon protein involved in translation (DUF1610 family)